MTRQAQLFTVDAFEAYLKDHPERLELIHGTVVEKPMPTEEHGLLVLRLSAQLMAFVERHGLGRVVVEVAYRAEGDTRNRRIPDASFTSSERARPLTKQGAVPHLPDLAIEVKSPDDSFAALREKANYYLTNGSRAVWLVFPSLARVEVHTPDGVTTLEHDDTLDGGAVVPGFALPLRALFAG